MTIYLHDQLKPYFSTQQPLFDQVMALSGDCYRQQKGRLTRRIRLGDNHYFIKQHTGVGWKEIFKNLFQLRRPVISAKNEWQAIAKLQTLGVSTPVVLGYGERGCNPAKRQSFILMQELVPALSLEDVSKDWCVTPPDFKFKFTMIKEVARIARELHQHGMNHKDLYICHFIVNKINLTLIDLHRAEMHKVLPERWAIKDLAGLYFSSKEIGLTERDRYRFMRFYCQQSLREIVSNKSAYWQKVKNRGEKLYRDHTS